MLFGRGKKSKAEKTGTAGTLGESDSAEVQGSAVAGTAAKGDFRGSKGPLDISEIESQDGYVDLGALLIAPADGLQLRLEVEEATQRVVAVTMDLGGSSLQLQAFAAPRSEGLWDEIREQISESVASQNGETEEISGASGPSWWRNCPQKPQMEAGASARPDSSASTVPVGSFGACWAARLR